MDDLEPDAEFFLEAERRAAEFLASLPPEYLSPIGKVLLAEYFDQAIDEPAPSNVYYLDDYR